MSQYQWALFFHILSAVLLAGGALTYHFLHLALLKRDRPSEIAALFGGAKIAATALQAGALGTIVFGIWLAFIGEPDYGFDGWVIAAIVLWVVANALGAVGGKIYEKGQKLAARLATEGDAPSAELAAVIRSPKAAALTYASTTLIVVILVLMVWKPGADF